MPVITLPDGSRREFDRPVTLMAVAESIGAGLAKAAIAGRIEDALVDLSTLVERDSRVSIVTSRDVDGVDVIRHSTAHLLAQAVKALYPTAQVTIGPVVDNGFYYDFSYERPFTPEDLVAIEKAMEALASEALEVERKEMPRDEAAAYFEGIGEAYKAEIIRDIPEGQVISLYRQGDFTDLCRGPHVPDTGKLRAFKLMKIAGAYWRGDSRNEMLQRIYGTAWGDKKDLKEYLVRLEEAERRDHRKIGKTLDLFHMQEEAPGMVFWHPKGWTLWQIVEQYMRGIFRDHGYEEIRTPLVVSRTLWEKSGHWEKFQADMFTTTSEQRDYAIKPMNCPCHVQVYNQGLRSYRELPLRLAEFGACHRNELSGVLHGLMRVRGFTQDDAHIFCTEGMVQAEVSTFIDLLHRVYADFKADLLISQVSFDSEALRTKGFNHFTRIIRL
ncbi:MAG: threonine--tRNA ligase, partial [Gammaproteobacteria bacterium]|nr:threonine--tRNA ligase [Gammaproteobacteria bacterium]